MCSRRRAALALGWILLAATSCAPAGPRAPTPGGRFVEAGLASWYGPGFHGRMTASGETFDQHALTAAHPRLAFGSLVRVVNESNGREVVVRINDRGPNVRGRIVDLSHAAAVRLDMVEAGVVRVRIFLLGGAGGAGPAD